MADLAKREIPSSGARIVGTDTPARTAKAGFADLVLVCAKCAKRQGLGKDAVRGRLKREIKRRGLKRTTRVVSVGCLGPCPKRFVAVATSGSLGRNRIVLVDPAASAEQAVDALLSAGFDRPPFSTPKGL